MQVMDMLSRHSLVYVGIVLTSNILIVRMRIALASAISIVSPSPKPTMKLITVSGDVRLQSERSRFRKRHMQEHSSGRVYKDVLILKVFQAYYFASIRH